MCPCSGLSLREMSKQLKPQLSQRYRGPYAQACLAPLQREGPTYPRVGLLSLCVSASVRAFLMYFQMQACLQMWTCEVRGEVTGSLRNSILVFP